MDSPFIASIVTWMPDFAPKGWAFCQGQILSIAQNQAVFALIGTTYGGNGSTTFALPDLRSRIPVGAGNGPGLSPVSLGQAAGSETQTMTDQTLPAHTHFALPELRPALPLSTAPATAPDPATGVLATGSVRIGSGPSARTFPVSNFTTAQANAVLPVTMPGDLTATPTGNSQPFSIMQPYTALNFIFAMQGIFPPRS